MELIKASSFIVDTLELSSFPIEVKFFKSEKEIDKPIDIDCRFYQEVMEARHGDLDKFFEEMKSKINVALNIK